MPNTRSRFRGCLLGLACGDALGTSVEFCPRGSFPRLTDMVGGGPFGLQPGQWTDDTSMALCLAASLLESDGFDAHDQMKRYCRWHEKGYFSSTGTCFDIGRTIHGALERFKTTGMAFSGSPDPLTAGNGCIMRLAPVPMYYYPNLSAAARMSGESSRTTHGAQECIDAAIALGTILFRILAGDDKETAVHCDVCRPDGTDLSPAIQAIAGAGYREKSAAEIRGTGYVVESLEAALWCFSRAEDYRSAVLAAANLGDDADTTAAVCGQLAGAFYGEEGLPDGWLKKIARRDEIRLLADRLYEHRPGM